MRKQILSGSFWLLVGNIGQQFLQLLTYILLARMLTASAFGYVALASVIIDIAAMIGVWGMVQIAEQRRNQLSGRLVAHIFAFSLLLATGISIVIIGGVCAFTYFYGFGLTTQLIVILVPILFLQALRLAPEGVLHRSMQFKWLAARNNIAALLGGGFALLLAFLGFEVYALVVQKLVALAALAIVVWIAAGKEVKILPLHQYSFKLLKALAYQGSQIVSLPISAMASARAVDGLIGAFLGVATLGAYKMCWRIYELVQQFTVEPLKAVSFSAFPKLIHDPEKLKSIYFELLLICALVTVPAFIGLGQVAPVLVPLVLGEKWVDSIPIFQTFSFIVVATVLGALQTPLLLSYRQNKKIMLQSIVGTALTSILVFAGVQINIEATVWAFILVSYLLVIYNQDIIQDVTEWPFFSSLKVVSPVLLCGSIMFICVELTNRYVDISDPLVKLICLVFAGASIYVLSVVLIYRGRLITLFKDAKENLAKKDICMPQNMFDFEKIE